MVGGDDNKPISSVELFPPNPRCSIPDLPQPRRGASLSLLSGGRLVVCGGRVGGDGSSDRFEKFDSCISWVEGNTEWTHFYTMRSQKCIASF